ncbi:hypothetical protein [Xylanimonas ulmi]|uniref:Uncharacterized protein n=1 Tax=Xylanimonas ulmi TaxID=228973 RepID=A0A4Q7M9P9_9MICO|nr:hypothetical protein [Xylanibacterium ulmi]RZS62949.1 hypothetical protein EV386_3306 [Xylanibacterium ulmi]
MVRRAATALTVLAVVFAALAVADALRWGNRAYVSMRFGQSGAQDFATSLAGQAAAAGQRGLALLALAASATGCALLLRRRCG